VTLSRSTLVRYRASWALAAAGALSLADCERKAPGPHECRRFALQALGLPEQPPPLPPRVQAAVDELTVRCITTPFDRQLTRCVDEGRGARRCLAEFERRALLESAPGTVEP
jgi:hypothetical protein